MNFLRPLVLVALSVNAFGAQIGDYSKEFNCIWDENGCANGGEYILDFRTQVQKEFDDAQECKTSIEGCSEHQIKLSELIEKDSGLVYYDEKEFASLLAQGERNPEKRAEYFIPLGLSDKEQIAALATASIGLVILGDGDEKVREFVQNNRNDVTDAIDEAGYIIGREGLAAISLGSYFMGAIMRDGELKELGLITVTAGLASQVITEAFKAGFGRTRPNTADGPYDFFNDGEKSFFSGHASGTWAIATVFAELYKDTWAGVPFIAYGVAGLVSYGRMNADKHWASDVTIGSLVGYLTGKLTLRIFEGDDSHGGVVISPGYDPVTGAYNVNFHWSASRPDTHNELDCDDFDNLPEAVRISACNKRLFDRNFDDRSFLQKVLEGSL